MMENKIILRKDLDRSLTHEELDGNFEVVNSINETIEKTGISQFQTIKEILPKVDTNWSFRYTSGGSTLNFIEGDEKFMSQWGQSIASVNFSKDKKSLIGLLTGGNGTGVIMGTINEGNKLQAELIADEDDNNWHNNMILPKEGVAAFDSSDDLSVNIIGFPADSSVLITDNKGTKKQILEVDIDDFGLNGIVSNDGTTIFIGSEDNLYIFKIDVDKFELFQTIEDIETKDNNDYISRALDTNKDGSTFIVGLPNENEVRIYELENDKYVLKSNITTPADSEYFGWDISISDNFNTLVISDMYFKNTETNEYDGIVYVYNKDDVGVWNKSQEINSSNQIDGDDTYGAMVELSEDAKLLIISAAKDETNSWIEVYELKETYELIGKKQLDDKIDKIMILNNTQFAVTNIIDGMTPRTSFINTVGGDVIALNNHSIITDNMLPTPIKPLVSVDNNGYILIDRNNKASNGGVAFGNSCAASGSSSFATGYRTSSKGKYSTALGYRSIADGNWSTTFGYFNQAKGNYSTAIGDNNKANGDYSTAIGHATNANGKYSTSIGSITKANGDYSTAMGYYTIASCKYSTTTGKYNKGLSTNLFEIGYGTGISSSKRKNVFEVSTSGTAKLNNSQVVTASNIASFLPDDEFDINDYLGLDYKITGTSITQAYTTIVNDTFLISYYMGSNSSINVYDKKTLKKLYSFKNGYTHRLMTINKDNILSISNNCSNNDLTNNGVIQVYELSTTEQTLKVELFGEMKDEYLGGSNIFVDNNLVFMTSSDKENNKKNTKIYNMETKEYTIIDTCVHYLKGINTDKQYLYAIGVKKIIIIDYNNNTVVKTIKLENVDNSWSSGNPLTVTDKFMIVGHPTFDDINQDNNNEGVVILYDLEGNEQHRFMDPNYYGDSSGDMFGSKKIFTNNDSSIMVVSAIGEDSDLKTNSGAIYIFDLVNGALLKTIAAKHINNKNVVLQDMTDNMIYVRSDKFKVYTIDLSIYNKVITTQRNKIPYNVETSYQPAHKMYVDDAITTAITPLYGKTDERPEESAIGTMYFDTDLNKPIWFNGTKWVLATGEDASEK